ncbi:hypothetical protein EIN_087630 [Entamoeba invadens IP1]|uniref:hypothetical protein n=1 Tax=Entamoeba invadens IP1 TaxID=370355 RepID=UPI0002C3EE6A|nr:hypothetical protein EIN_087630 [Entamoeba invadens IP1]ELP85441.1 hypothetical protein EIN_087630 [Entamoeba invadens IP1]|eukprot:XP_004184787.1 hypothetical protein EIN_087630 [Entamoeba invadens IP1]
MGCCLSKKSNKVTESTPLNDQKTTPNTETVPAQTTTTYQGIDNTKQDAPKEQKQAEGTHTPQPKGDAPVIEDRPNGKKEVVSGDKSILLDEIYAKHYGKVDKKHDAVEEAKKAWLASKESKSPDTQEKHDAFQNLKKEFEDSKLEAHRGAFNEVQIYMNEEDTIDLHGLQIEGAILMMKEQIEQRKSQGKKVLKLQCGMGHHNTVGFSKIKEEVVKQLQEMKITYTEEADHGLVIANL